MLEKEYGIIWKVIGSKMRRGQKLQRIIRISCCFQFVHAMTLGLLCLVLHVLMDVPAHWILTLF